MQDVSTFCINSYLCAGSVWQFIKLKKYLLWNVELMPYSGIPFVILGKKVLACHLGFDKNKYAKQKSKNSSQVRQ